MTRLEEVLLERMTVRRWCAAVAIGAMLFGSVGYQASRHQVTNEFGASVSETTTTLMTLRRGVGSSRPRRRHSKSRRLAWKASQSRRAK